MKTSALSLSPVSLSYIAALRGHLPRRPGESFTYAQANCTSPELLIALAASNPEGKFYGFVSDTDLCAKATKKAFERQVMNVSFLGMKLSSLVKGDATLPELDYLVCDESQFAMANAERAAVYDCAANNLKAGGLFNYTYRAYENGGECLRFLVREFAPEMNVQEANVFLDEIKKLGRLYLQNDPSLSVKLDQAIARSMPDEFFQLFENGEARSPTFDAVVAMRTRGLTYAGDAQIGFNYVELSIPAEAQPILNACEKNPLYESIKDFAALNPVRSDIWCKEPAPMSESQPELFGCFAYGITVAEDQVPPSVHVFGKTVDLSTPVYRELIALMTTQPAGIGDFLHSEAGKVFSAGDIVQALHVLVALGIARPMRGARETGNVSSLAQPRFSGSFNRFIDTMSVTGDTLAMASPVMGDVVRIAAREVLVMQALNRAGLANSVSALLPELERIAKDPSSSARVTEVVDPTAETAYQMINDVVSHSIVQWYAYGLLEAA